MGPVGHIAFGSGILSDGTGYFLSGGTTSDILGDDAGDGSLSSCGPEIAPYC